MRAVTKRWPHVLVQFEDFSNENALPILEKYRYKYLCFNDDIQGTGAVALSGVLSALRIRGSDVKSLAKERIVIVGAGSAGVGVANSLAWTMVTELGIRPEVRNQLDFLYHECRLIVIALLGSIRQLLVD
jgi:malic enzyme